MGRNIILITAVVLITSFAANTLAEISPKYVVIDLGIGTALSINNNGQIVGQSRFQHGESWFNRATLFDPNGDGNNIDLGTLGGDESWAFSINDNGQIAGCAENSSDYTRAVIFDPNGTANNVDLGTLPDANESRAVSINNNGQIVGSVDIGDAMYMQNVAVLFDPNGTGNNINLGTLGGDVSFASCINDNGQIVGSAYTASSEYQHPTLFDATGGENNIDMVTPGGDIGIAHSINDNGQIVGWSAVPGPGYLDWRAVIFDPCDSNNNVNLGTIDFPGNIFHNYSYARSINNNGQIVGYVDVAISGLNAVLFDATGDGNNILLNDLIDPDSELVIEEAYGINDDGWIVGLGRYNRLGSYRAILLKPVTCTEPLAGDVNDDCKVDLADFAIISNNWLGCNLDPPEACW